MKSTMELSIITDLFQEKEKELKNIVGNLQLDEVKTDEDIRTTAREIENRLLLEPVTIGSAKIVGHRSEQKDMPRSFHNPMGGPQTINTITVEFPCSGSKELFNHRGHGALSIGRIYPPSGDRILVEVTLQQLDKDTALAQANAEIKITKELISMNNPEVDAWAISMKDRIKKAVEHKAKEVRDLYA